MLTSSHLEDPGNGTNCHLQELPPTLSPWLGSDGAARNLLVQEVLAVANTLVGVEMLSWAMVANFQTALAGFPPSWFLVLRLTKLLEQSLLVPEAML